MNDKLTVTCYACSQPFTPDPIKVKVWADSGRPFDPTDWLCPTCSTEVAAYFDSLEDKDGQPQPEYFDIPLFPSVSVAHLQPPVGQPFDDDRDFDTYDGQQPTYTCANCNTGLVYLDSDILVCPNCNTHHILFWDPECQAYEAIPADEEGEADSGFPQCPNCHCDMFYLHEDEAHCPKCNQTFVLITDDDISEVAARDALNTLINLVRHTIHQEALQ